MQNIEYNGLCQHSFCCKSQKENSLYCHQHSVPDPPTVADPLADLLKAATAALLLLRTVQAKDMEESGDYSAMPYPEIVDLENSLSAYAVKS